MLFQSSFFGFQMLGVCILTLIIILYTLKKRENDLHNYLLGFEVFVLLYSFSYTLYILFVPIWLKLLALAAEYMVLVFVFTLWLLFVCKYLEYEKVFEPKNMVLIFIIPIIVFISAVSDPWTHLISTPIVAPGVVEGVMFKREIMSIVGLIYGI